MTVKEALDKAACGGCAGGRHLGSCFCNDLDYELVQHWQHKYPIGSIDISREIFGVTLDRKRLLADPRFQMYNKDLAMDINEWLKTNV